MTDAKQIIFDEVNSIKPFDELEQKHKEDVMAWVKSDTPLYRISKPDDPPKHLVCYFVLYDPQLSQLLLIDHIKANLWLPAGGHVEIDEHPRTTVSREAYEELQVRANFDTVFGPNPLFVTVTETKGQGSHTDVSLWYVVKGNSRHTLAYDEAEMRSYKWLSLQEVLRTALTEMDPHMHRFVTKMQRTSYNIAGLHS